MRWQILCNRTSLLALLSAAAGAIPAHAQTGPAPPGASPQAAPGQAAAASEQAAEPTAADAADDSPATDILSRSTFSVLLDGRAVLADGGLSFVKGGFGKTRFSGAIDGDYKARLVPVEAALIWTPRFTRTISANVSGAWQRGQDHDVDMLEAFVTFLPPRTGAVGFSAKGGIYWPEISLEHATGGAWSTVHTLTPSAINSWVGEEVKVAGTEATISLSLGEHDLSATGAAFWGNDTSGTLLSFRGWALHDVKATVFGHFELPPLNAFMTNAQAPTTRSFLEIDSRVGFYGRVEWRPPIPVIINAFYYDNRGDPSEFTPGLQWGWRTRFGNVGVIADLAQGTRLLAQGMIGTTLMGNFSPGATRRWVDTRFRSAYALLAQEIGRGEISGRAEVFDTKERGFRMSPNDSEKGWAIAGSGRLAVTNWLTAFAEIMHVHSKRGTRIVLEPSAVEKQTVFQLALRVRL
jgi:hypothetical protein